MKKQLMALVIVAALLVPAGVMAMKGMDHGGMIHDGEPSGMDMGGEMIMLQDQKVDGVMGSAHLMDVKAMMAEHGMELTHHMMVGFMTDAGEGIRQGKVAVKVASPDGQMGQAIKMMGMSGQFGADINLDQKGTYQFMVGTKLADGKKRTFLFQYEN